MSQIKTKFITNNAITNTKISQRAGRSVIGNNGTTTQNVTDIIGTQGQILYSSATGLAFSTTPTLGVNTASTGQLILANGNAAGTSVTIQNIANTTAYNFNLPATPGTAGQVLVSGGGSSAPMTWSPGFIGAKNYLSAYTASTSSGVANSGNGNFELGTTAGFSLGNVTVTSGLPTGVPTFGSGSSGNLSLSIVSSGQLAATTSAQYVSSAASVAGDFVASNAFFIDAEDQAKVMTVKVYYSLNSGAANTNFSSSSSNSFGMAIWDVTNSAWIIPAGVFGMNQNSGSGYLTGTFQTTANSTQYRLVIYNANASTGAFTLYLDDLSVSPQTAPLGAAITDPVAYVPNFVGFGTVTGINFVSWRAGAYLFVEGTFTAGTTTATEARIDLGFQGQNANLSTLSTLPTLSAVGEMKGGTASTTFFATGTVTAEASKTYFTLSANNSTTALAKSNGSVFTSAQTYSLNAKFPIAGWSSNVQMSNDTDTRVIAFANYGGTPTGTLSNAYNKVTYPAGSTKFDTNAAYSAPTYTVQIAGKYSVTASFGVTATQTTSSDNVVAIYKNGTIQYQQDVRGQAAVSEQMNPSVAGILDCVPGDTIEIFSLVSGSGAAFVSTNAVNSFTVQRISGPSTIASTESVACLYNGPVSTSIPNGSNYTVVAMPTKQFDTHNAYNTTTGLYTTPVSGTYVVSANVGNYASASFTSGGVESGSILINSTTTETYHLNQTQNATTATQTPYVGGSSVVVHLNAGDTVALGTVHNETTARSLSGIAARQYFSIARTGN